MEKAVKLNQIKSEIMDKLIESQDVAQMMPVMVALDVLGLTLERLILCYQKEDGDTFEKLMEMLNKEFQKDWGFRLVWMGKE
jgi:hypothetical protein